MQDKPQSHGAALQAVRDRAPLIHNITNYVAMNFMANVLLAVGASPAMVHARPEAAEFAGLSQALTVNIGTADPDWGASMREAAGVMAKAGRPWILDPVGVGATLFRQELSAELLALRPTIVRGNASEIMALAGLGGAGRGVDAGDSVASAEAAARALATTTGGVVAISGAVDYATDGARATRIANGHTIMPRITAMGCSLNGVIAAFATVQSPFEATLSAMALFGLAGEVAGQTAEGPGSFQPAFLDALYRITPEQLDAGARIEAAA